MESAPAEDSHGVAHYLLSPTIAITIILVAVYVLVSISVGNFISPIYFGELNGNLLVLTLTQCDIPTPIFPWSVVTAIFLHANPIHLISNLFFLVFFGFILEERVTKS